MPFPKALVAFAILAMTLQGQLIPPTSATLYPFASSILHQSVTPQQNCCLDQSITVYGSSTIQAAPDTATLTVQITVNSDTVSNAITALSAQVNTVISILTSNGLSSSNYQVSSLNVNPNTSYANGFSTVVGQIASETFTVTIPMLNSNGSNIGKIIDSLATVNNIILNDLSFDLVNKTEQLALARSNAFSNAQKKALDYATSLQLSLGQLQTIVDSYSSAPVIQQVQNPLLTSNAAITTTPTTINVGTIPINYNVQAVYAFTC